MLYAAKECIFHACFRFSTTSRTAVQDDIRARLMKHQLLLCWLIIMHDPMCHQRFLLFFRDMFLAALFKTGPVWKNGARTGFFRAGAIFPGMGGVGAWDRNASRLLR
jgi:hypothetical protein